MNRDHLLWAQPCSDFELHLIPG
uniref:Uncharacterized protein n=1 Tax=Moniliophthora roreri TaxID=221103 RepID=A0A0W0G0U9_MONRR